VSGQTSKEGPLSAVGTRDVVRRFRTAAWYRENASVQWGVLQSLVMEDKEGAMGKTAALTSIKGERRQRGPGGQVGDRRAEYEGARNNS